MPNFCLIPSEVEKFKGALISGKIDPAKLSEMSSAERNEFFKDIVGKDNATGVNALFESKLLLKNQQKGMVSWAKKVSGITPEVRRDMLARIQRLDQVLDPSEEKAFLHDLAETKLGVSVTPEEAKTIANMSRKVEDTQAAIDHTSKAGSKSRLDYGRAVVQLENYVLDKKQSATKMRPMDFIKHPVKTASMSAGQFKAINASMDDSAIFNQGWKVLMTHPIIWQRNARKTFSDMVKQFGGKNVEDEIRAGIISRENALDGTYRKMGLDIGTMEEPFPTHLPSHIPGVGRAYHASEAAFAGFQWRNRADLADLYLDIAKKSGAYSKDTAWLKSLGKFVNSLTSRGDLGRLEGAAGYVNNIMFSPRNLKANYDILTAHQFQKGVTPFVRKQAAYNLVKIVMGTAAVLAIADAVKPGSVEWNPRSSDFGKIKIGHTRFNVTGGMGSIVTLASRILPDPKDLATGKGLHFYSKSSTTKQVTELNSGKYGSQTAMDVVWNFFEGKASPVAGVARDMLKGQDMQGRPFSPARSAVSLVTPLSVQNYTELRSDPQSANNLAAMIADGLGIVTNTYGKSQNNWNQKANKELTAFKQKVGQSKFDQANQQYNQKLDAAMTKVIDSAKYKSMDSDQQKALLTTEKARLQKDILGSYGFKYRAPKSNQAKDNKNLLKSLGL